MNPNFLKIIRYLPSILWMMVIFYFSSQSTSDVGYSGINRFILFKTMHLIEYAVLGAFLLLALKDYKPTTLTGYLYAVSDEFHQSFTPGRGPKFSDTLIDLIGILIGILAFQYTLRFLKVKVLKK